MENYEGYERGTIKSEKLDAAFEAYYLGYPYQSTGIAKLKNGTVIGGVRHQFKNTPTGIEARTVVEFPFACPKAITNEHQKHLAVEWSSWIAWAIEHQE